VAGQEALGGGGDIGYGSATQRAVSDSGVADKFEGQSYILLKIKSYRAIPQSLIWTSKDKYTYVLYYIGKLNVASTCFKYYD